MRYLNLLILAICLSLGGATACATDSVEEPDSGGQDTRQDTSTDADSLADATGSTDTHSDATLADTHKTPDSGNDVAPFCTPSQNTCADASTKRICAPDGSEFIEEACEDDQECENGSCVAPALCEPGDTQCYDGTTRLICRPSGSDWRSETCEADTSCVEGECVSGSPNGQPCTANDDCANGLCRCGAEDDCDPVGGNDVTPYCTETCTPGSCGAGQTCVSAQDFPVAGQDHCVQVCNQTCALDGMTCASIPTRDSGELSFEQACVPAGVVDIGLECSAATADACAGGTCLQDYFEIGLCTSECDGDCPNGTACVKLKPNSDLYQCSPICGDGTPGGSSDCPLEGGQDLSSVTCATKVTSDGDATQVCVSTRTFD